MFHMDDRSRKKEDKASGLSTMKGQATRKVVLGMELNHVCKAQALNGTFEPLAGTIGLAAQWRH